MLTCDSCSILEMMTEAFHGVVTPCDSPEKVVGYREDTGMDR